MIVLSICIASYNKAELTERLVKSLLKIDSDEYNVVVVDNCSTDDTVERLERLSASKLTIIKNEKNIGGAANTIKAPYSGTGLFSLYVNDRDLVINEKIPAFITFLKENKTIVGGYCNRNIDKNLPGFKLFEKKEGLINYSYRTSHPTGFFYNSEQLKKIAFSDILDILGEISFVPLVHEYLVARLCCMGTFAIYNNVVWKSTGDSTHNKYVSSYVPLDKKDDITKKWFHPSDCLRRAQYNIKDVLKLNNQFNLNLSQNDLEKLCANILYYETGIAIWRYRNIMRTPSLAYHYSVEPRKFGICEAIRSSKKFRDDYINLINGIFNDSKIRSSLILSAGRKRDYEQLKGMFLLMLSNAYHRNIK